MTLSTTTTSSRFFTRLRRPLLKRNVALSSWKVISNVAVGRTFTTNSNTDDNDDNSNSTKPPFDMAYSPVNAFQMNQYVIACTTTRHAAIVDCGVSTKQELAIYLEWISTKQYKLTAIWQTHAHLDHVAGLGLLTSSTEEDYSNIPIYVHERERNIYNNFALRCKEFGFDVENQTLPGEEMINFFDDSLTQISLGELTFDILSTPGHSPGHVGFLESKYTKSFFGGDFIMQGSIGRTDFPTSNHAEMENSLERFVKDQDDNTIIYPGHGPPTVLKQEKQTNPFLRKYV